MQPQPKSRPAGWVYVARLLLRLASRGNGQPQESLVSINSSAPGVEADLVQGLPRYERSIVYEALRLAEVIDSSLTVILRLPICRARKCTWPNASQQSALKASHCSRRKFCALEQTCISGLVAIAMAGQQRCLDAWRKAVGYAASPCSTKPIAGRHQYRKFGRFCAMQHCGRVIRCEVGYLPLTRTYTVYLGVAAFDLQGTRLAIADDSNVLNARRYFWYLCSCAGPAEASGAVL